MRAGAAQGRDGLLDRGLRLEYFTVLWNVGEAVVGIAAGVVAGSLALVGFGLDSVVEASSASVLIWRLRAERSGARAGEDVERKALLLVAGAFVALALYVGVRAVADLLDEARPEESLPGIVLAVVSLVVMPVLAVRKRAVARALGSRSLEADATQTFLCMYLSAFLLVGLVANAALGWWWADPLAGIAIAAWALKEAWELWEDDEH